MVAGFCEFGSSALAFEAAAGQWVYSAGTGVRAVVFIEVGVSSECANNVISDLSGQRDCVDNWCV